MQSSYALEVSPRRLFSALSVGDVLGDADESHRFSGVVLHRKAARTDPPDRTVRSDQPILAGKLLRSGSVGLLHAPAVFRMNQLELKSRIVVKAFAAAAGYFFESGADVIDRRAIGAGDVKDLADVLRQLAESLLALA